jgi:hypothetical protein
LLRGRERIGLLNTDQKSALEVEKGVQVEEDVVDLVAANDTLLFNKLLELLQKLEVLDVRALGLDQLVDNVLALRALNRRAGRGAVIKVGSCWVDLAHLDELVEDAVDDVGDLVS